MLPAGPVGVLGIDLRQRDERAAILGPGDLLRQLVDRRLVREHGSAAHELRPHVPERARHVAIAPRILPKTRGIDLQLHEMPYGIEHVAKEKPCPLDGAKKVADHRKPATLDAAVEESRPARGVDAPLNFRRFEIRIDLVIETDQLPRPLQIGDTFAETAVTHSIRFLISRPATGALHTEWRLMPPATDPLSVYQNDDAHGPPYCSNSG